MAKLIESGNISKHVAGALVLSSASDFTPEEFAALDARYGLDANGNSVLSTYLNWLSPETVEGWGPGEVYPVAYGEGANEIILIFVNIIAPSGEAGYDHIRDSIKKVLTNAGKIGSGVKHSACGVLGRGAGILPHALEPIMGAAGGDLVIDIYDGYNASV